MNYIKPKALEGSFTCPHCGTISQQHWVGIAWNGHKHSNWDENVIRVGRCQHCIQNTLWIRDKMYFPDTGTAPYPNSEMPEPVKKLYEEAASIQLKSPRGAGALLRLAIQVLCKELGEPGNDINKDISMLVKKGLPEIVQQSLDIVRVTGNDAVHPGQIDTDNPEVVNNLFKLINLIIEYMIALPKEVSGIYGQLPKNKLDGINVRDKK
jgi:hypothetical protein